MTVLNAKNGRRKPWRMKLPGLGYVVIGSAPFRSQPKRPFDSFGRGLLRGLSKNGY